MCSSKRANLCPAKGPAVCLPPVTAMGCGWACWERAGSPIRRSGPRSGRRPSAWARTNEGRGRQMKGQGHGEKLSRKQEALISALLLAPTLADAAHIAGIGEVTAWRWLKEPTVQAAYREARRAVVQHAIVQLQRAAGEAVETLRSVMQNKI